MTLSIARSLVQLLFGPPSRFLLSRRLMSDVLGHTIVPGICGHLCSCRRLRLRLRLRLLRRPTSSQEQEDQLSDDADG